VLPRGSNVTQLGGGQAPSVQNGMNRSIAPIFIEAHNHSPFHGESRWINRITVHGERQGFCKRI
jgi:hypothetical protein